jgi:hypothetical protein
MQRCREGATTSFCNPNKDDGILSVSTKASGQQSPYTRAFIFDGITSFVTDDPEPQIVVYNLLAGEAVCTLPYVPKGGLVEDLQANADYVVWAEPTSAGSAEKDYFLYDQNQETVRNLNLGAVSSDIFSVHLLQDSLVVNDHKRNALTRADLRTGKLYDVTGAGAPLYLCASAGGSRMVALREQGAAAIVLVVWR